MYEKFTIQNFRGIKYLTIEDCRRVNLLVGKNSCGKTTILESLFLLTGPANPNLPSRINVFRGLKPIDENSWRMLFNKFDVNSNVKMSGQLKEPLERRNLIIKPNLKSTLYITPAKTTTDKELIDIKDSYSGLAPTIEGLILEYSFTRRGRKPKKITTKITKKGPGIEITTPRDYEEPLRGVFINPNTISVNMAKRFNNIQIRKETQRIIGVLRQMDRSLNDLSLGENGIIYCDIGLDRLVPINALGDGMFRLLSIILAISDTQNGIVLIDEIENGFHYSSQQILWNAIFKSADEFNVQIFATTHSLECVKTLSSSYSRLAQNNDNIRLYRIERKDDQFKVVSYDHQTLEASLDSEWEVR